MTAHPRFAPFNFQDWIARNKDSLKPPVSNKQLFDEKTGMIVMIVGGPNQRVDFHDDPVHEFFYQLRGDMLLEGRRGRQDLRRAIREGHVFLLPRPRATRRSGRCGLGRSGGRGRARRACSTASSGSASGAARRCILEVATKDMATRICRRSTRRYLPTRRRAYLQELRHCASRQDPARGLGGDVIPARRNLIFVTFGRSRFQAGNGALLHRIVGHVLQFASPTYLAETGACPLVSRPTKTSKLVSGRNSKMMKRAVLAGLSFGLGRRRCAGPGSKSWAHSAYSGVGAELAQPIDRGVELYLKTHADDMKPYTIKLIKRDAKDASGATAKIVVQELLTQDNVDVLAGWALRRMRLRLHR